MIIAHLFDGKFKGCHRIVLADIHSDKYSFLTPFSPFDPQTRAWVMPPLTKFLITILQQVNFWRTASV